MDTVPLKQKLHEEGFPHIYEWRDEPGTDYPAHAHKGEVAMYILQGRITFFFANATVVELDEGDRFDVPSEPYIPPE